MRGPPVVLTPTLGRPVTNVISERGAVPMTVVNTLGEPVTLVAQGGEPVTLFNESGTLWDYPFSLFSNNEQGAWYDPSDFSTLYQDAAGTTPVTAVEQPVRLMLDRSRGLVLGSELVTNGTFDTNLNGWTLSGTTLPTWSAAGIVLFSDGYFFSRARQTFTTVSGRTYALTFNVVTPAGSVNVKIGTSAGASNVLASGILGTAGARSFVFVAQGTTTHIELENGSTASPVLDNISIKALPGNHATAPNDASRPVLRARYNLYERSEEFDNAYWTKIRSSISINAATAPDGTTTADKLIEDTTATNSHDLRRSVTVINGASYTVSMYAKAAERTAFGIYAAFSTANALTYFNLANGTVGTVAANATAAIQDAGNGWYRCSVTVTANATTGSVFNYISSGTTTGSENYTGDGTSGILIWGASLLTAADQSATGGAYQRIGAATDYDTSNPVWRPYLAFDGSDDSMSTSSIDFSGTDEMTVFAGLTKLSDANPAVVVEFGIQSASSNGFGLFAPDNNAVARYGVECYGTARNSRLYETYAAPVTNVITAKLTTTAANSAAAMQIRINAAAVSGALNVENASTGNFSNKSLFIGRRNDTSVPFNGRLTSLIVLGRTATADEISVTEGWVNGKTGAY